MGIRNKMMCMAHVQFVNRQTTKHQAYGLWPQLLEGLWSQNSVQVWVEDVEDHRNFW